MELLEVIGKHKKDFKKWFYDGEQFTTELEEALLEAFKDQMPYTVKTGETADPTEWLNDKLSSLELRDIFSKGDNSNYLIKEEDDA